MLQGRYQIEQEIGAGAHGKVYRAMDHQEKSPVAIKRLRTGLVSTEPEILNRFRREADALRRLNHPNIVHAIEAFAEGDDHYIVMEYLAGGSLRALMDDTPCLPLERALRLALDLSDALARAHRLNIIHRDLKPANVLLADDGTPRLTDFGVALIRDQERVTDSNSVVGTLNYIAPEGLNGDNLDEGADIWSFGVMFYEMLAGRRPFVAENPTALIVAVLTQPPADLEALRPDIPPAVVDLVYRMLDKDPRVRIASVRRVGAELEAILREIETGEIMALTVEPMIPPRTPPAVTAILDVTPPVKHNIPAQSTPFVGRDWEIDELMRMLCPPSGSTTLPAAPRPRLVTVIASGGMGKSRLSLEIAARMLETNSGTALYPDGVYFVSLAPLPSADRIPGAIAEAVGYPMKADGRDPIQQIGSYLAERRILLILDNFEHLTAGAESMSQLLSAAPGLTLLITSRERLNLSAEHLFPLEGLPIPSETSPSSPLEYSAVRLFVQSAQRANPKFKLEEVDVPHVSAICRIVQGLPLGLVLAATWAEMLTPKEIAEELGKSADFLEANMQDLPERHRSMRAVFEYSWQRLTPVEQKTLARLSVFRGAFSRAAAQAVTGSSLRDLMLLVNKSLLHRDTDSGYYNLHELIRQFAESQLKTNDEDYRSALDAHSRYYCFWLRDLTSAALGPQMQAVLPMDAEIDNIRRAWQHAISRKDAAALEAAEQTLYVYYRLRSLEGERIPTFNEAIAALETLPPSSDRDRALGRLLARQGELYIRLIELDHARDLLERSVTLLTDAEDQAALVFASAHLGEYWSRTEPLSEKGAMLAQDALTLARQCGHIAYEAMIELWQAFRANRNHRLQEGLDWAEKAYKHFRQIQQPEGMADSLRAMAMLYQQTGEAALAIEKLEEALPHYKAIGDWAGVNICWIDQAVYHNFLGQYEAARQVIEKAQTLMKDHSLHLRQPQILTILGDLAYQQGQYADSIAHFKQALKYPQFLGVSLFGRLFPMAYMARSYIALKRLAEAEQILNEMDYISRNHPVTSAFPMRIRAQWLATQGRFSRAEQQYHEALKLILVKGYDMPALPYVVLGLAEVWQTQRRLEAAVRAAQFVVVDQSTWAGDRRTALAILADVRPLLRAGRWITIEKEVANSSLKAYAQSVLDQAAAT